jgi:hypothetical protein
MESHDRSITDAERASERNSTRLQRLREYGYHLSDGTIDLAILRFKTDQIGKGLDYAGLHHFGILVDDVEKFSNRVEALSGTHYMDQAGDRAGGFEVKLYGPEGVLFDIAEHPWTGTEPLPAEQAEAAD